jgi:hypothetical protein
MAMDFQILDARRATLAGVIQLEKGKSLKKIINIPGFVCRGCSRVPAPKKSYQWWKVNGRPRLITS